jgi:two-component system nitrate/nitrite response regulator NarL
MSNSDSQAHFHENKQCVAYAGIVGHVRGLVRKLCANHSRFTLCVDRSSTALLLREISRAQPEIVLIDDALLNRRGLAELGELHSALPAARTIIIGDSLQLATISSAVSLGVWGVLSRMRVPFHLERALYAVANGELWFSRHQLTSLMMLTNSEQPDDLIDLTPRENEVMHAVLKGQSNKQIARSLSIAEHTVKIHLYHLYAKLHVHRRVELFLQYRADLEPRARCGRSDAHAIGITAPYVR